MCACVNLWNDTRRINFVNKISIVVFHAEHEWWKWNGNGNRDPGTRQASKQARRMNEWMSELTYKSIHYHHAERWFSFLLFNTHFYCVQHAHCLFRILAPSEKKKTESGNNTYTVYFIFWSDSMLSNQRLQTCVWCENGKKMPVNTKPWFFLRVQNLRTFRIECTTLLQSFCMNRAQFFPFCLWTHSLIS